MTRLRGFLSVLLAAASLATSAVLGDTLLVLPGPSSPKGSPSSVLGAADVGERHCNQARCVLLTSNDDQKSHLAALAQANLIVYQPIGGADELRFQNGTWNAKDQAFLTSFPGIGEFPSGEDGLFGIAFKSYLEPGWLDGLAQNGFTPVAPLPVMGYLAYGPRGKLNAITKLPYVKAAMEIPAGLKRFSVDIPPEEVDPGAALPTTVAYAEVPGSSARAWITAKAGGRLPSRTYAQGLIRAYALPLTREQAIEISGYADVVEVERSPGRGGPSDERTNRIICGDPSYWSPWRDTSPTEPIPAQNDSYWDTFISAIAQSNPGFNLDNQVIGFLDTGVPGPTDICPTYLDPDGNNQTNDCRLVFRADVTEDHLVDSTRAQEVHGHGAQTTAIAAGYHSGPYAHGYSFTKGVAGGVPGLALGARVAMVKTLRSGFAVCDSGVWRGDFAEDPFCDGLNCDEPRVRYGLVELCATGRLPDQTGTGYPGGQDSPGVKIVNHSWNLQGGAGTYEGISRLLDKTARDATTVEFRFGTPSNPVPKTPASGSILHVISAGNSDGSAAEILPPGLAKNALTVGATYTYNQETYPDYQTQGGEILTVNRLCYPETSPSHPGYNSSTLNASPRAVAPFSRHGVTWTRKPDLVAPGARAGGPKSSSLVERTSSPYCAVHCAWNLAGSNLAWSVGTSFSAPAVSSAAAMIAEWHRAVLASNFDFEGQCMERYAPGTTTSVSPAFLRAALVAGAIPIGNVAPNNLQGYGGLSIDRAFRWPTDAFFYDQKTLFTPSSPVWERTVVRNGSEPGKPVVVSLVWTDPPGTLLAPRMINSLDLNVHATVAGVAYDWWGDAMYTGIYSTRNPQVFYEADFQVARVLIDPSQLPAGTDITIRVYPTAIVGDALNVGDCTPPCVPIPRQDFAVVGYGINPVYCLP